jgi:hypothetical protein
MIDKIIKDISQQAQIDLHHPQLYNNKNSQNSVLWEQYSSQWMKNFRIVSVILKK